MNPALFAIQSHEFGVLCCPLGFPKPLHGYLSKQEAVLGIREAYLKKELTENEIREFVKELMNNFQTGFHFGNEHTLAALAVALEPIEDPVADEFIDELAELKLAEMPIAPRVARICQELRNGRKNSTSGRADSGNS